MPASSFSKVLVPVDFSASTDELVASGLRVEVGELKIEYASASAQALEIAARTVAETGELRLLHVTPALDQAAVYSGVARFGLPQSAIDDIHRDATRASIEVLEHLAGRYCPGTKVSCHARPGIALDAILEEATSFEADLIVLPASGRNRVARFFLGSTADRVIREARCPVLVIPRAAETDEMRPTGTSPQRTS